jgi:CDP-glycerol glycerophosphotransferase (TagB/SpsB family)
MTRDEVDEMSNFLAHSDLVITPASTLAVEAPIFDTPTIVTFFNTVSSELLSKVARTGWLERHFRRVQKNDWLPLAFSPEDLLSMMKRSLKDRSWYREGRRQLVDEVVTFRDGKSYERVAAFIDQHCPAPSGASDSA